MSKYLENHNGALYQAIAVYNVSKIHWIDLRELLAKRLAKKFA